jgi:hypothetical protein
MRCVEWKVPLCEASQLFLLLLPSWRSWNAIRTLNFCYWYELYAGKVMYVNRAAYYANLLQPMDLLTRITQLPYWPSLHIYSLRARYWNQECLSELYSRRHRYLVVSFVR